MRSDDEKENDAAERNRIPRVDVEAALFGDGQDGANGRGRDGCDSRDSRDIRDTGDTRDGKPRTVSGSDFEARRLRACAFRTGIPVLRVRAATADRDARVQATSAAGVRMNLAELRLPPLPMPHARKPGYAARLRR